MRPLFLPIPDDIATHYRAGGLDAYGLPPERAVSDGAGVPCRHALRLLGESEPYFIVAHRPFSGLNPYTETGPIFVGAEPGPAAAPSYKVTVTMYAPGYIVRGYSAQERILYGTGRVVPTGEIIAACTALLRQESVAFVHIRSASNNCFTVRVERG